LDNISNKEWKMENGENKRCFDFSFPYTNATIMPQGLPLDYQCIILFGVRFRTLLRSQADN